ncbi:MAG: DUF1361 domain-containing protein [Aphanocapsa lilacina HA4352-LM1]|jgi:uncharacterized membrane protein|nr:DUF1361 domain-containing protein [Aphanocapsa lilacina HA4352-LM1]
MKQLLYWAAEALAALSRNLRWMGWNLFLALVPLALSFWLFDPKRRRSPLWWGVAAVWLAFLPNAPYVLTDVIHLIEQIRSRGYSAWVITLALIPQYLLFILVGFEAYVLSLVLMGRYLRQQGLARWILPIELAIHALSAVGIYLGRFQRFNSWDIVTQPDAIVDDLFNDLIDKEPLLVMGITFAVVAGLYYLLKVVSLALIYYWRRGRAPDGAEWTA